MLVADLYCLSFSVFQHDSGSDCTPGEAKTQDQKERGNYIMYARATSGDKFNNNKFSICSIRNISQVLDKKRFSCFVGEILSSNKKMAHDSGLRLWAGNQERLLQILLRWTQMRHLTWDCSRRIVTCNELMAMFCSNVASKLQKTYSTSPNHAAMIKQSTFFLSPFLFFLLYVLFQNLDSPSVVMEWLRLMNSVTVAIVISAGTRAAMMPMRMMSWSVDWSQKLYAGV